MNASWNHPKGREKLVVEADYGISPGFLKATE